MRDKSRIKRILSKIEIVMEKENKWFMEVIEESLKDPPNDPFYIEDKTLENNIDETFEYVKDSNNELESTVMYRLASKWEENPDLRLLQLVCNSIPRKDNPINKENKYKEDIYNLHDGEFFEYILN